jgi:hypothetical protein
MTDGNGQETVGTQREVTMLTILLIIVLILLFVGGGLGFRRRGRRGL